jgi:hypothetical protein
LGQGDYIFGQVLGTMPSISILIKDVHKLLAFK